MCSFYVLFAFIVVWMGDTCEEENDPERLVNLLLVGSWCVHVLCPCDLDYSVGDIYGII